MVIHAQLPDAAVAALRHRDVGPFSARNGRVRSPIPRRGESRGRVERARGFSLREVALSVTSAVGGAGCGDGGGDGCGGDPWARRRVGVAPRALRGAVASRWRRRGGGGRGDGRAPRRGGSAAFGAVAAGARRHRGRRLASRPLHRRRPAPCVRSDPRRCAPSRFVAAWRRRRPMRSRRCAERAMNVIAGQSASCGRLDLADEAQLASVRARRRHRVLDASDANMVRGTRRRDGGQDGAGKPLER